MARADQETAKITSTKRKAAAGKSRARKVAPVTQVTSQRRHEMIAEAAYLLAEQRGFTGNPTDDWLLAEQEVDANLAGQAVVS